MAFTEAELTALIDSSRTRRIVNIKKFNNNPNGLQTDMYCIGIVMPYAGRSRWVSVPQTQTAAQAWTAIRNSLT